MSEQRIPLATRVLRDCIGVSSAAAEDIAADMNEEELNTLAAIGKELSDREEFIKKRRQVEVDKREPVPKWPMLGPQASTVYSSYLDRKRPQPTAPQPEQPTDS